MVSMPAVSPARSIEQRASTQPSVAGRVIVLSSDPKLVAAVCRILNSHDFAVLSFCSPGPALEALDSGTPTDLILLDAGHDSKHLLSWMKHLTNQRNALLPEAAI